MRIHLLLPFAAVLACGLAAPGASAEPAGQQRICVDVRIGQETHYDCLNALLRQSVPARRNTAADAPFGVASPANQVGGFTVQGTRQMLGSSFGTSVVPQRLPAADVSNPAFARSAVR